MEARCLREPLLRTSAYSLHSFLVPFLVPTLRNRSPAVSTPHKRLPNRRCLSTSVSFRYDRPSPTKNPEEQDTMEKARADFKNIFDRSSAGRRPSQMSPQTPGTSYMNPKINAKLDELFPPNRSAPPPTSAAALEVTNAYKAFRSRSGLKSGSIAGSMLMPFDTDASRVQQPNGVPRGRSKRTLRYRPSLGRSFEVDEKRGQDFGRALQLLNRLLFTGKIALYQNQQKAHERPGLKKKRLVSERAVRRFDKGISATIDRAILMKKQGW